MDTSDTTTYLAGHFIIGEFIKETKRSGTNKENKPYTIHNWRFHCEMPDEPQYIVIAVPPEVPNPPALEEGQHYLVCVSLYSGEGSSVIRARLSPNFPVIPAPMLRART